MVNEQVTTIELTAGTPSTVEFSGAYPYYWVDNKSDSEVYASLGTPEAGTDGTYTIAAGSQLRISGGAFNTKITLLGSGKVQVIASAIASCPFKGAQGGGDYAVAGASSYTLNNAVDYPLLGLNLYGKSVQDGTPTPDAPVDIVSVGNGGSVNIKTCGKNLFPWNDYTKAPINSWGNSSSGKFRVSSSEIQLDVDPNTVSPGGGLYIWKGNYFTDLISPYYGNAVTISYELKSDSEITVMHGFEAKYVSSVVNNTWKRYSCTRMFNNFNDATNICWKTYKQPETKLYIRKIQIEIGDTATDYEPYNGTTANITTALPLCGIPVDSDGNYTDSNGQQWICDELIYNADGTGKIVKRIGKVVFDGSDDEGWKKSDSTLRFYGNAITDIYKCQYAFEPSMIMCNRYVSRSDYETYNKKLTGIAANTELKLMIYDEERATWTIGEWKSWLAENPIIAIYKLAESQEITLTAAEMTALRQLQTFDGVSNISNDNNADMDVKYCTNKMLSECVFPITTGLQKQIDELKAAVLSLGGNV